MTAVDIPSIVDDGWHIVTIAILLYATSKIVHRFIDSLLNK